MTMATLSSKYQLVIPKEIRKQLNLHSGQKMAFLVKGNSVTLVPEKPFSALKGLAKGMDIQGYREKKERKL